MQSRIIVAAIIEKDGKFLLGQKPKNIGPYPNTWHLLGGGIKLEEESLEEALQREITEEAGVKIENIEKISFDEDYEPNKNGEMTHYIFLTFKAKCTEEPTPSDDIEELQWFKKEELKDIVLTRPSEKLFKELGYI